MARCPSFTLDRRKERSPRCTLCNTLIVGCGALYGADHQQAIESLGNATMGQPPSISYLPSLHASHGAPAREFSVMSAVAFQEA
jgi:hypothetical protein